MKIGDDNFGPFKIRKHIARNEFATLIVAVRVIRQENTESVTDRNTGCDNEKASGKLLAARSAHGINSLPGNEHGHDGSLARTRG